MGVLNRATAPAPSVLPAAAPASVEIAYGVSKLLCAHVKSKELTKTVKLIHPSLTAIVLRKKCDLRNG
jgi:hypothetical protein